MSELLSSGDVCEIAGLAPNTFDEWVRKGIVVPVEGGDGQGSHRRFSVTQTVGIAVANALRSQERGCALSFVGKVVEAFGAMTEKDLLSAFGPNKTHLVMIHRGRPVLAEKAYDWVNVYAAYENTKRQIAKLAKRPRNAVGRNRGLVS